LLLFTQNIFISVLTPLQKKEYYESVHLSEFPISDEDFINPELENKINKVRNICSLALSIRKKEKLKVRQPLSKIIIPVKDKNEKNEIENAKDQILSEINVKSIEFLNSKDSLLIKELIPNFKILGPRYGSIINDVANIIKGFSQKEIEDLESNGKANFRIKETDVSIDLGDVEINYKDIEGLSVASGDGTTIALDLKLDQNLLNEGIARELVNRIQNIRKSKDLEVTDKIEINIKKSEKLANAIKSNLDYIKGETLANKLYFSENFNDEGETLEFDDIKTVITINKI